MLKFILSFLILFQLNSLFSFQLTVNVNSVPSYSNAADNIFLAGSFNNWEPSNSTYLMTNNGDGNYSITFETSGLIEFKFTKGSFLMVEKDANCQEIANRTYTINSNQTLNLQIANWRDYCDGASQHTAAANVSIISENFAIPQLNSSRRVWVYLPPDYANSTKIYPVIYMQDAQNIFDAFYSFSGEWEVDESMNLLFNQGDFGAIIVGIDNGGSERINEYSPWVNPSYGGGDGDLYMEFIVNTLKPYIDLNYRTNPIREKTALIGSSMGALISFYGGIRFQSVFSKLGIFSPSFWFSDEVFTFVNQNPSTENTRIYFLAGANESTTMVPKINTMVSTLTNNQYAANEINTVIKSDGQHSEWFWKREFSAAYQWLFQENTSGQKKNELIETYSIIQNENFLKIKSDQAFEYSILDSNGQIIIHNFEQIESNVNLEKLQKGIYQLVLKNQLGVCSKKILKM